MHSLVLQPSHDSSGTSSPTVMDMTSRYSPVPMATMSSSSSIGLEYYGSIPDPTLSTTPNPLKAYQEALLSNVPRVVSAPGQIAAPEASSSTEVAAVATKPARKAKNGETTAKRRQKRLERNRESARLSRRRRKQYLEVLEENVNKLSKQLDCERRAHVKVAVETIRQQRLELLQRQDLPFSSVERRLARASPEMAVVNTFQAQQLRSFAFPPSTKFILWLTLQNDDFFRGGRASSERLSAARIGERMLSGGTDRVTPDKSMWPLFCNEVGLSYEQEEKVRCYQRKLLQTHETWLHRHTAFAAEKTMQSLHDATQAITARLAQKEIATQSILNEQQRLRLTAWANNNRITLQDMTSKVERSSIQSKFKISNEQHEAANLYTINHHLQLVLEKIPHAIPVVPAKDVQKLSRRPLFESLGCVSHNSDPDLRRENSSGSLKRSCSEMSMQSEGGEERVHVPSVNPQEAQAAANQLVETVLGPFKEIIPDPPVATYASVGQTTMVLPAPTPVSSMTQLFYPALRLGDDSPQAAAPMATAPVAAWTMHTGFAPNPMVFQQEIFQEGPETKHARKSSFLPPHLNVVPEEMWAPGEHAADDFLMNLVDGDWAIGEGIDMDAAS